MLIIAVVGPTATGKSALAVEVAARAEPGGEVINADAFSLYRGMDIGTAKTSVRERRGVPHHQVDVLGPEQDASVAQFQEAARADVESIVARGLRPVVVGGSGLYVRALLDEIEFPGTDLLVRARIEARGQQLGARGLHEELRRLDPPAAGAIEPGNLKRIVRALEVIEITGRRFSAHLPRRRYFYPTLQIGLDCDRDFLDERIAQRVEKMFANGLVEEVAALNDQGMGRTASRAVGYAEVLAHLRGDLTLEEARAAIITNTRRLTRKQMGWFGRDPRIHWLNATDPNLVGTALELVAAAAAGTLPQVADPDVDVRRPLGTTRFSSAQP